MIFRVRYAAGSGHVRCRVFAGATDGALGMCGDLVFRLDEFVAFRAATEHLIQFVDEYATLTTETKDENALEGPRPARDR